MIEPCCNDPACFCGGYDPEASDLTPDMTFVSGADYDKLRAELAACAHKEAQYVTKIATYEKRIEFLRDGLREIWGTGDRDSLSRFIENLQDEDDRLAGGV